MHWETSYTCFALTPNYGNLKLKEKKLKMTQKIFPTINPSETNAQCYS